jgi:hypothetical protein
MNYSPQALSGVVPPITSGASLHEQVMGHE